MLGECAKAPTNKACSVSVIPTEVGASRQCRTFQLLIRKHGKGCYRTDFSRRRGRSKCFHRLQPTSRQLQITACRNTTVEAPLHSRQQVLMQGFTGLKGLVLQGSR